MSNIAFDQLLQITAPPSPAQRVQPSGNEGDLFRSHLDRAADAADAKDSPRSEEPTSAKIDQDEAIEPETEQQDTSTNERDEVAPEDSATPDDSTNTAKADEDETNATDDAIEGDEVTLSAAVAAAIVEAEEAAQPALQAIEVSGSPSSSGQDSADQGTPQPTPESVPSTNSPQASPDTSQLDPTAISQDVTKEVPLQPATNESSKSATSQRNLPATAAASGEAPTDSSLVETASTPSANGSNDQPQATTPATQTPTANTSEQTLPENSADQGSSNSKQSSNLPAQQQQISDTTAPIADPLTDTKGTTTQSDTSTATPPNANASTANQALATTARTPGVATATQASDSGSDAARSTSSDTPAIDHVRFVRRVGGAIRSAQQRDGQIQLRLSPPELGTLKIQLTVNEGAITANLETETASARTVLLDNLPALRERLSEQGMTIEKFDVDVGREGQQQAQQQTADQREANRSNNSNNPQSKRSDQEPSSAAELSPAAVPTNPDDGLDIRI